MKNKYFSMIAVLVIMLAFGTANVFAQCVIPIGPGQSASFAVTVSPNPTSGIVTIASNSADGEVTVIDLFGRKVASATMQEGRTEVDLSGCTKGVYMARISSEVGTRTIKLVKE